MDDNLQIKITSTDKTMITLCTKRTETLRSVLKTAKITPPPNSQILCFLKETQLKLDLSLGIQGIQTDDTIFVSYKKISRHRHRRSAYPFEIFSPFYQDAQQVSNRQNGVYLESLRLNDHYYYSFDYYRNSSKIYAQLLRQQQEKYITKEPPTEKLVISNDIHNQVSCDPLPVCFKSDPKTEENEDSDSFITHMHRFGTVSNVMKTNDETNLQS